MISPEQKQTCSCSDSPRALSSDSTTPHDPSETEKDHCRPPAHKIISHLSCNIHPKYECCWFGSLTHCRQVVLELNGSQADVLQFVNLLFEAVVEFLHHHQGFVTSQGHLSHAARHPNALLTCHYWIERAIFKEWYVSFQWSKLVGVHLPFSFPNKYKCNCIYSSRISLKRFIGVQLFYVFMCNTFYWIELTESLNQYNDHCIARISVPDYSHIFFGHITAFMHVSRHCTSKFTFRWQSTV